MRHWLLLAPLLAPLTAPLVLAESMAPEVVVHASATCGQT